MHIGITDEDLHNGAKEIVFCLFVSFLIART